MDAKKFINKYGYQLEGFFEICQADTPRRKKYHLELNEGDVSYCDSESKRIVVGVNSINLEEILPILKKEFGKELLRSEMKEIDALYYIAVKYLIGHELQHKKSTRQKDYTVAQDSFKKALYEGISKYLKDGYVFRSEKDYELYLEKLNADGYQISKELVDMMAQGVPNCLEDGRTERIRGILHVGFEKTRSIIRSVLWLTDNSVETYEEGEPEKKDALEIILNQILSLSTNKIYQKGYMERFGETEMHKKVRELNRLCAKAVKATTCRGIVKPSMDIARILAEYFIEFAQSGKSSEDLKNTLSSMMPAPSSNFEELGNQEETAEGVGENPLGMSELEDEEETNPSEDKGAESDSSSKKSDEGEETDSGSEGDGNSGSREESEDDSDNMESSMSVKGSETADDTDNDDESRSSTSSEKGESSGKGSGESESEDGEADDNASKEGNLDDKVNIDADPSGKDFFHTGKGNDEIKDIDINVDEIVKKVLDKMKNAAKIMEGDLNTAKKTATSAKAPTNKIPEQKPYKPKEIKGLSKVGFKELFREYDLNTRIPFSLENRSEHFAQEIKELFEREEKPLIKGINAGHLDSKNIFKLALGRIDCFEKKDEADEIDACAYFLLDNSGSMGNGHGSKRYWACQALTVVEAGFSKHMPIKITAFDDNNVVIHEVIKNWDEVLESSGSYNFLHKGRYGAGNMDGYSIRVATEELEARPESQKMLFILSDGQPAGSHGYYGEAANADVKFAVEEARSKGIQVLSIYFSETFSYIETLKEQGRLADAKKYEEYAKNEIAPFKAMYGNQIIMCSPEEIEENLVKEVKNFVF